MAARDYEFRRQLGTASSGPIVPADLGGRIARTLLPHAANTVDAQQGQPGGNTPALRRPGHAARMGGLNASSPTPAIMRQPATPAPATPTPTAIAQPQVPTSTVTPNPSAASGPQFWRDQQASIQRPAAPVATAAAPQQPRISRPNFDPHGYAYSQAARNLDMAQNKAEFNAKKTGLTRTQRQAMGAADQAGINFWQDQAASLGPAAAQKMAELQAQQQGENFRTLSRNAMQQNISAGRDAAGLAQAQIGADAQNFATMASTIQRPARDYAAEAETRLMGDLIGAQRDPITGALIPNAGTMARQAIQQYRMQPGYVMDGYRFKGGDPGQQASWEPI